MFKLRQLEIFRAVMQAGTVTTAAEALQMSQPAATKAVRTWGTGSASRCSTSARAPGARVVVNDLVVLGRAKAERALPFSVGFEVGGIHLDVLEHLEPAEPADTLLASADLVTAVEPAKRV